MSRYDDDGYRRGYGADYTYANDGGGHRYQRAPSPGYPAYNGTSQARLTYEPQGPYPAEESGLRPRSFPAARDGADSRRSSRDERRGRGYSRHDGDSYDEGSDDDRARTRTPIDKARKYVGNTFTDTTTGLGVGVLGALVGGLAGREAADFRKKGHHDNAEHKRNQLISTVVGAAVGALGANAVEKRIEVHRQRDEVKQEKWERRWRPETEALERTGVVVRPRSKGRSHYSDDRDLERGDGGGSGRGESRRGVEREVDLGARSWKNVEDWILDSANGYPEENRGHGRDARPRSRSRSRGHRDDAYRY
ncbi:hypothetical protein GGS20DRAFT_584867 [Poronia punctata]|nr:hypothetical protein GGS20DRAFT_584867 [Poronia punctata]